MKNIKVKLSLQVDYDELISIFMIVSINHSLSLFGRLLLKQWWWGHLQGQVPNTGHRMASESLGQLVLFQTVPICMLH